jgi:site-specific DNA recombinase
MPNISFLIAICFPEISYFFNRHHDRKAGIGSMYPENLTFDGFLVRTARVNEVARLIFNIDEAFRGNKKGQKSENTPLSCLVTPSGHSSNHLPADLDRLSKIIVA